MATATLSVGVLSVLGLQLVSKRVNTDAHAQSFASQLAYDMIERMRINDTAVALTQYEVMASAGIGRGQQGAKPNPACDSAANACNGSQLAAHDVWLLEQELDGAAEVITGGTTKVGGVVNPTACITGPPWGAVGTYVVTIAWRSKTPLPVDRSVPCGLGLGLYGTTGAGECPAGDDCLRRTVQVSAYIE